MTVTVDKPAAGGRMIARQNGQVLLVSGAVPGERLRVRIERVGRGVAFAEPIAVEEPSPDRRDPFVDPLCGGCLYAHISYPRQLEIKGQIVGDAFHRIARIELRDAVTVTPSPDEGYRMRARLHYRSGRVGFFREGSHEVCDARHTRQLLPATCDVVDRMAEGFRSTNVASLRELELSENQEASQRAVHLVTAPFEDLRALATIAPPGLTGLTGASGLVLAGEPFVIDRLDLEGYAVTWRRHVLAFFQGNRYLLRDLILHVLARISRNDAVVDLYAGVGLFSVAAAATRSARVTAVESDRVAAQDLAFNAEQGGGDVRAVHQSVEAFAANSRPQADVLLLDPPRTGLSSEALAGAIGLRAATIVYVSCDVATLARDARQIVDAGYVLERVDGFDLFPNTPHVETVAVFRR